MTFRVATLGAGYFAQFHHEAWQRNPRADLVGVADSDIARARASGAPAFESLGAMLNSTAPDIVDIAIPPGGHAEAIRAALKVSPRAIICQKPFCSALDEAEATCAAAEEAGIPLIVHENFRFQPWYRAMADAIDAGMIGEVLQGAFRLRTGDGQGADAYLARQPYFQKMPRFLIHETGVHFIDVFRYLIGPITSVFADLRQINPAIAGEDAGMVIFGFAGPARAIFDGNRLLDHAAKDHRTTLGEALIEGTKGALTLDGAGIVRHRAKGAVDQSVVFAPAELRGFGGDCVYALQDHVLRALDGESTLENTARDYLAVLKVEEAIYRSAERGQRMEVTVQ